MRCERTPYSNRKTTNILFVPQILSNMLPFEYPTGLNDFTNFEPCTIRFSEVRHIRIVWIFAEVLCSKCVKRKWDGPKQRFSVHLVAAYSRYSVTKSTNPEKNDPEKPWMTLTLLNILAAEELNIWIQHFVKDMNCNFIRLILYETHSWRAFLCVAELLTIAYRLWAWRPRPWSPKPRPNTAGKTHSIKFKQIYLLSVLFMTV